MVTNFWEVAQITEESLFEVVEAIFETSPDSLTCLDYVMSATDYTEFLESMLNRKRLKNWEGWNNLTILVVKCFTIELH